MRRIPPLSPILYPLFSILSFLLLSPATAQGQFQINTKAPPPAPPSNATASPSPTPAPQNPRPTEFNHPLVSGKDRHKNSAF